MAKHNSRPGSLSEGDYLKISLQLLQVQIDVSGLTRLAEVAGSGSIMRSSSAMTRCPANFDVIGDLAYRAAHRQRGVAGKALRQRPDFRAAELGVTAAQSQIRLAKANASRSM